METEPAVRAAGRAEGGALGRGPASPVTRGRSAAALQILFPNHFHKLCFG